MGVRTTFDERREEAKELLSKAIVAVMECLNENTWGYSEMKDEVIDEMTNILSELIKMKRKL